MRRALTKLKPKTFSLTMVLCLWYLSVDSIQMRCVFDRVTIHAKVKKVYEKETLNNGLVKQDVIVSDSSAVGKVMLWGSHIGTVEVTKCHLFLAFMVNQYSGNKYLTMNREGSDIKTAEDIPTAMDIADLEDHGGLLNNAVIIAVSTKKVCILCQGTVEPDCSELLCYSAIQHL